MLIGQFYFSVAVGFEYICKTSWSSFAEVSHTIKMWAASCLASCCAACACDACRTVVSGISRRSARIAYCGLFALSLIVSWILREVAAPLMEKIPCKCLLCITGFWELNLFCIIEFYKHELKTLCIVFPPLDMLMFINFDFVSISWEVLN